MLNSTTHTYILKLFMKHKIYVFLYHWGKRHNVMDNFFVSQKMRARYDFIFSYTYIVTYYIL